MNDPGRQLSQIHQLFEPDKSSHIEYLLLDVPRSGNHLTIHCSTPRLAD